MKAADVVIVSTSCMVLGQILSYRPNGMLPLNWGAVCFIVS